MGTIKDEGLDPAMWDELLQLFGREGVAEMLRAVRGDLPQQRQRLDAALRAQDRDAIKRIAHSLRGVALQFGATSLAEYCGDVERAVAGEVALTTIAGDATIMLDRQFALTRRLNDTLRGH